MATANPARAYPVQPRIGYSGGGRLGAVIDTLGWGFPQTKTVFGSAQPHLYYIIFYTPWPSSAFGPRPPRRRAHAQRQLLYRRQSPPRVTIYYYIIVITLNICIYK